MYTFMFDTVAADRFSADHATRLCRDFWVMNANSAGLWFFFHKASAEISTIITIGDALPFNGKTNWTPIEGASLCGISYKRIFGHLTI
jgi:hypothetical protein